ncbi:unnamed protein product, partial [Porites evermanni]
LIKLFGRQKILNFKKTSAEENLRFRRDHGTSFNPCVKEVKVLLINATHGVKEHVCYNTTILGCNPVNGKYLCEKRLSIFLLTVIIVFFHYSVYARPKSREDWMGQDNDDQATSQTLGKEMKLFSRQKFLNANKITEERSLRFRRNHNTTSNPCVKAVKLEMVAIGLAVKVHECFTTTNLGCQPVNGKFLCEKIKTVDQDSA